ncbi:D-isomer specific 2-hydroxyacid dehydrogenase NAD-binding protein [Pseudopedobacter saltans DSM 12145]|uniref:D-isomer specific 2-hydroxyacid dehydrogenase NAD-binding protein n=1 Tax=Pseudopedobacter saltans (strain ATCC 51119 / DSM 12145 / JCM 21818 / CCUG 39354 / LMG 10337 / NBRC 100064 / NCIMB 13643) TaxID=762903 RepID=F0SDG4_PSESL|nr:2-hydroxyacid dehydrogenase [Pseudopedobacter saltans]ADY53947.1 D-isomer specific 2-hydroxyacid dehydrogenase NAD-binding protein [Pseudopedobacter saltans DSM 12145]
MRIAFFSSKSYDKEYFKKYARNYNHDIIFFETALTEKTANLTEGCEAVCVFVNDKVDKETIAILSKLGVKGILLRCAGYNNIDLEAAKEHHIKVLRVPAYSPEAVAEHSLALIMTLNRKTHKAFNRVRENNFSIEHLVGFNLFEKTVGLIGTGLIGQAFAKIMLGLGCKVIAFDVYENESLKKLGINYLPLDEVFEQADIISLHCPLTPETKYIINKENISKMKDGVMIINTSRGALINTKDVIGGLKSQKIGYLGLDVYEQEEDIFFRDLSESVLKDETISRLMSFPNVLITSHQGFFTKEALGQIATVTLNNATVLENGEVLLNEVL